MRVGFGYDSHKFCEGRDLILGGVHVPHDKGLLGHSDADVLMHAVIDALLGAAKLGDIGRLFPDTDPVFEGVFSSVLLKKVYRKLQDAGYKLTNIDTVIVTEKPRLAPYVAQMEQNIADYLGIDADCVSVKAKTGEGMGFVGRGEGIAAQAVCLIEKG